MRQVLRPNKGLAHVCRFTDGSYRVAFRDSSSETWPPPFLSAIDAAAYAGGDGTRVEYSEDALHGLVTELALAENMRRLEQVGKEPPE